jgi:hypothetical protein
MFFDDPVCGQYAVTHHAEFALKDEVKKKFKIACVLSERFTRGGHKPVLIRSIDGPAETKNGFHAMGIDELLALYPKSPLEMIEQSLINLSVQIEHPGDTITIKPEQCYLLYSPDSNGVAYVLRQLESLGYVAQEGSTQEDWSLTIETNGWSKLQELASSAKSALRQIFVAMWFSPEMDVFYKQGIFPAVEEFGMRCVRIDQVDHNNKICDEIIAEIRRSRAVVADFSGQRGGVYYEAGFAQGLGLPVIWTVKKDELAKVHFDTRQYNHIVYETAAELKDALLNRLRATVSQNQA